MNDADIIAKLDKPGAGLPLLESLITRWFVGPFVSRKYGWDENRRRFEKTTAALLKEIEGLDDRQLTTRILVPPQRGLEDSSRYWSAAMLFEHLIIVGTAVTGGIISLSKGVVPPVKVDTGKVKPSGEADAAGIIRKYRDFAALVQMSLEKEVADKDSKAVLQHPWLGPLNCRQWHWLLAVHQGIHLQQLRAIVKGLKAPA